MSNEIARIENLPGLAGSWDVEPMTLTRTADGWDLYDSTEVRHYTTAESAIAAWLAAIAEMVQWCHETDNETGAAQWTAELEWSQALTVEILEDES